MERSEKITTISKALLAAQKKIEKAIKDSDNPHFRSKYAGLPEVIDACKDQLNAEGIIVLQPIISSPEGNFVETTLIHSDSGEFFTSKMQLILDKVNMQGFGSAVTYARRYAISSLIFLASEDDDGESAVGRGPTVEQKKKEIGQSFRKKPESSGGI